MKIDIARRRKRIARIQKIRRSQTAQTGGNQRRRSSVTAPDEKVAPAKINRIICLRWLTQRDAPKIQV